MSAAEMRPAAVVAKAVKLEQLNSFDSGGTCYSLALAPDGSTALLGGNMGNRRMAVWNVQTQAVERTIPKLGIFVAVSPDGKHAACTELVEGGFRKAVTLFDAEVTYSGIQDVDLSIGARNLFNIFPPGRGPGLARSGLIYDNHSVFGVAGGFYYLNAKYKF